MFNCSSKMQHGPKHNRRAFVGFNRTTPDLTCILPPFWLLPPLSAPRSLKVRMSAFQAEDAGFKSRRGGHYFSYKPQFYNVLSKTTEGIFHVKESAYSDHITGESLKEESPSQSRQDKIDAAAYREMHNPLSQLIGKSPEMDLIKDKIKKWANNNRPILLLGDSGVGKKYTARIIHEYSSPIL